MHAVSVLPGAVKDILTYGSWENRNIIVYISHANQIILMDDTTCLQIIPIKHQSENISCDFDPDTGKIICLSGNNLAVYNAVQHFGQLPRWELDITFTTKMICTSIAWLNDHHVIGIGEDGMLGIFDIELQSKLWGCKTAGKHLTKHHKAESLLIYDPSVSSKISLLRLNLESLEVSIRSESALNTGPFPVCDAWFVTPSTVAALTNEAIFIWNCDTAQLLVTIPKTGESLVVIAPSLNGSLFLQVGSMAYFLTLETEVKLKSTSCLNTESVSTTVEMRIAKYASPSRVYIRSNDELYIFAGVEEEEQHQRPASIGSIRGIPLSQDLNLSYGEMQIVAGDSLLNTELEIVSNNVTVSPGSSIVDSKWVSPHQLLTIERDPESHFTLVFSEDGNYIWTRKTSRPLALGIFEDSANVIFGDGSVGSFHLKDGTPFAVQRFPYRNFDEAVIHGHIALIRISDRVEVWNLEDLEKGNIFAKQYPMVYAINLSMTSMAFVAYSYENECCLDCINILPSTATHSISIGKGSVITMAFSVGTNCLAILTTERLLIFGLIPVLRGQMIKLAQYNSRDNDISIFSEFLSKSAMSWSLDSRKIVLFNGIQLLALDTKLDDTSNDLIKEYSFDLRFTDISDLAALCHQLGTQIPIYHPRVLLLCLEALQPYLVRIILAELAKQIRYGEISDSGDLVFIDPFLKMKSSNAVQENNSNEFANLQIEDLLPLLRKHKVSGLSRYEQSLLESIAISTSLYDKLDPYALCAFVLSSLKNKLYTVPHGKIWVYSWFSETKLQLWDALQNESKENNYESFPPIWLDQATLKQELEQYAKKQFAMCRDPTSVTLYYVALRNLSGLKTLWRVSSGHPEREKTLKLLNNDFTTTRWRAAAQKNAFALLSKHRPQYAAALFLLGDSVKDCCQVCVDKLHNMELAIAIARVYDGDDGVGVVFLRSRYFSTNLTDNQQESSIWLQFWINWLLNDRMMGLDTLMSKVESDISVACLCSAQGGHWSENSVNHWRKAFRRYGIPEVISLTLFRKLESLSHSTPQIEECIPDKDFPKDTSKENIFETRALPANLKPPPEVANLEPDMSAFGF